MQRIIFTVALLLSTPAFAVANFSGHWIATTGKVNSNVGIKGDCSKIELVIEQTDSVVHTKSYKVDCGTYSSHWGPVKDFYRGGKVYEGEGEDEEEVGTITDDTMITVVHDASVAYAFNLKLQKKPDGSFALQTYYGVKNAVGAIAIEGIAEKVNP